MYLSLTDLPSTPDSGHDYGLASQDSAHQTVAPRQSYNAFKAFVKGADGEGGRADPRPPRRQGSTGR